MARMASTEAPPAGSVRVVNEVIASIAAMAAESVEGVIAMDEASVRHFGDWIKRQSTHRGVRVLVDTQRAIHLELFLTVDVAATVGDLAAAVQDAVVESVERMLALDVAEVNVYV